MSLTHRVAALLTEAAIDLVDVSMMLDDDNVFRVLFAKAKQKCVADCEV
jgi:hypothetical protein